MSKEKHQKYDELTEIIIEASEKWLKEFGRMHLHLEHKAEYIAAEVRDAGYRKQSEGEWLKHYRSGVTVSEGYVSSCCDMWNNRNSHFCPNCGANMKGGAE